MREVILLVLGAALGYAAGWMQQVLGDRRKRKSVATALLAEYVRLDSMLEYFTERWRGGKAVSEFSTPMFDRVPEVVDLFEPLAVARLLDFYGFLTEVRRGLLFLTTVEHPEQRSRMIDEIRELAGDVRKKGRLVRSSLIGAGAKPLAQARLSAIDEARLAG